MTKTVERRFPTAIEIIACHHVKPIAIKELPVM